MSEISTEVPTTPGQPLPDWERDLIALDAQRQEQFNAWIDKQGYVDPLGQLAEAFEGGWADAAAHAASSGYRGAAQHTYTDACDGFHPVGEQCNLPAAPEPAKAIVVTDGVGREHRYAAPNFGMLHDGTLVIGDKTAGEDLRVDAAYAPRHWMKAHKDGALTDGPDPYSAQGKKLAIALDALKAIEDEPHVGFGPERATKALDDIRELDL